MGYYDAEIYRSFELEPDKPGREVRMELMRAVRVRGVARDRVTWKPIAGAKVSPIVRWGPPSFDRGPHGGRTVKTDASGRFALDVLAGAEFVLQHEAYIDRSGHRAHRAEYDGTDVWAD